MPHAMTANYSFDIVPNVGTFYSQRGNMAFPAWEHFIPTLGIVAKCLLPIIAHIVANARSIVVNTRSILMNAGSVPTNHNKNFYAGVRSVAY